MNASYCTILGGGVAGLAAAHYARRAGIPCTLFEAAPELGGNARTLKVALPAGEFRFDTGAHRFHDLDAGITDEIQRILPGELRRVTAPSRIHYRGRLVDFPPRGANLLRTLGPAFCLRAGLGLGWTRLAPPAGTDFRSAALRQYGPGIAGPFLLEYTEKLWGLPAGRLSPAVAGRRLDGLHLRSFLHDAVLGPDPRARTMDGAFLYPHDGIGRIAEALAESAGRDRLYPGTPVTKLRHDGRWITAVETAGQRHQVQAGIGLVLSTLPLSVLLTLLDPPPPASVLAAGGDLRYRDILLVAVFLDRPAVTDNATVYFPGSDVPFTRVCEPRNRSSLMAPPGKTSLVAEIPLPGGGSAAEGGSPAGKADASPAEDAVRRTLQALRDIGWIQGGEVLGTAHRRLRHAYPVLEVGVDLKLTEAMAWLAGLQNLRIAGRAGAFAYSHLHDQLRAATDLVTEMAIAGDGAGFTSGFTSTGSPARGSRPWCSPPSAVAASGRPASSVCSRRGLPR